MKKVYRIYQIRTECYYQDIEASSLEEAIEDSYDSTEPLEAVDGTLSWSVDEDTTRRENSQYSVIVGGNEVNDYYLSIRDAEKVYQQYICDGYTDVHIVKKEEYGEVKADTNKLLQEISEVSYD